MSVNPLNPDDNEILKKNANGVFSDVGNLCNGHSACSVLLQSAAVSSISVIREDETFTEVDSSKKTVFELKKSIIMTRSMSQSNILSGKAQIPQIFEEPSSSASSSSSEIPAFFSPVLRSGGHENIGGRRSMEDAHIIVDDLSSLWATCNYSVGTQQAFYGVFDGHGGKAAAHYARDNLVKYVIQDSFFPTEIFSAFRRAIEKTDFELEMKYKEGSESLSSGTTVIACYVNGRSLIVANVGDSRAVLSRGGKPVDLSFDQKPSVPAEKQRILAAGGTIDSDNYLNGELALARALGNWHLTELKKRGLDSKIAGPLISEPELREETLTAEDEFLIIACDGLWDAMTSREAVSFARERLQEHNDPQRCSEDLARKAMESSNDNVTVLVVAFREGPPPKIQKAPPWRRGMRKSASSVDVFCGVQQRSSSS